ncbi:hypothetical protein LOTGIDRAFT_228200 [Lottia gigantea]|uniref:Peptidase M12B domain-containing protein n=1 Tax=Lottia gigantea TaxID=225164 RepID=V4AUQ4_LOTGI|nr:hypothetical protein LOTGIDRAFT_228200 [Lottia gigantea]ESO97531.1 hypothetical protein LOTGIDRAFT_228200 [Lottia gigantea]
MAKVTLTISDQIIMTLSCDQYLFLKPVCDGLRFLHIGEDELIKGDKVYIVHNVNQNQLLRHKRDLPGMPHELSFNFVYDDKHIHFNLTRGKQHLTTPVYVMNDGIPTPTKSLSTELVFNQNSGVYRSDNNDGVFMIQKADNDLNNYILGGTFVIGNKEFTLKPGKHEDEHKGVHYIQDHSLMKRSAATVARDRVAINYGHDWKDLEISNTENQRKTQEPIENSHGHAHHHRRKRQVASHTVEIFFLVDYFDYQKFYIYNNNDSTAAQNDVILYYAFIEECMNVKYGTIPEVDASLSVQIKSSGMFIATQFDYQKWINGNVNGGQIDKDKAIVALRDYVGENADYLPVSDHMMAFTGGDLDNAAGYAYIGSVCSTSAVSLVENSFDGFSCGVAAHELGHSLNCVHDGLTGTGCSDDTNNIMATILNFPTGVSDAPNPWKFSTCSVAAIKKQLQDVTCTNPENTSGPRALSTNSLHSGQVYDADEQCKRISNDSTVRFCRNFYFSNPSFGDMCWAMFCGKAGASCTYNIAYEGTSCGDRKWCEKGLCVENSKAPSRFDIFDINEHLNSKFTEKYVNELKNWILSVPRAFQLSVNMSRASKSGLAADIERKLENQYDAADKVGTPAAVMTWIQAVVGDEHPGCSGTDWKSISGHLRDGVMLCKFINKLLKSEGKAPVSFQKKCASPFVFMTNVENFNKGAETYGLKKEDCFQTTDLTEPRKGPFLNVVNSLHSLGSYANSKGYEVTYLGVEQPTLDRE